MTTPGDTDYVVTGRLLGATLRDPPWPGVVVVRGGEIVAAGPQRGIPRGRRIDLGDLVLIPGLIDAHVHLMWSGKPRALLDAIDLPTAYLAAQCTRNLSEALAAGITTVRDCGGLDEVVFPVRQAVRDGVIDGPRLLVSGPPLTNPGGHCHYLGNEVSGVEAVRAAVRRLHERGADFIKVMATGGGGTPGTDTRSAQYDPEELDAMAEEAHLLGLVIIAHAHGTHGIRRLVDAGHDEIEHCSWLDHTDGVEYDADCAASMRARGIRVCRTIAGFERWPLEELGPEHRAWDAFAPLRAMAECGIDLVAGTDAGIDQTGFGGLRLTLETMVGLGGLSHGQAFHAATRGAARALGIERIAGSLEPGRSADLIAVSGDPRHDIRHLRDVRFVMARGRVIRGHTQ